MKILKWFNKAFDNEPSVFSHLFVNAGQLLNQRFWRTYDFEKGLYQVAIVKMDWLKDYCGNTDIPLDPDYPNLYIARQSKLAKGIVIEVSSDETSILHAVFIQDTPNPFALPDELTDDPQLQRAIVTFFDYLLKRLNSMSQPILQRPLAVSLPLPSDDIESYLGRLEFLLNQGIEPPKIYWRPIKDGDIARRIRQLGMYRDDDHSVQGVYDDTGRTHNLWEVLNPLERAQHEKRVLGQCRLDFGDWQIGLTLILRDKFQSSGAGTIFLLTLGDKSYIISLNEQDQLVSAKFFEGGVNLDDCSSYSRHDMEEIIEKWWDGLRLEPIWERLLAVVDKRWEDVNIEFLRKNLRDWLELVDDSPDP